MARILKQDVEQEVANEILVTLEQTGYEPEELIPGLVSALEILANRTNNPGQALDEAVDLLDAQD